MPNRRVMLKLSGEALAGEKHFGFSDDVIFAVAKQVKEAVSQGVEVAIVIGGCTVAQDFFRIAPLTPRILPYLALCLVISVIIFNRISERYIHNYAKDRFFDLVVRLMGGKSTYSSSADTND